MSGDRLSSLQWRILEILSNVEPPVRMRIGKAAIEVDTPHEILVNKLCALLGRSELRDLEDVRVLLEKGGNLKRALADAPLKDGGFSPLVLAWVLRSFKTRALASAVGMRDEDAERLEEFRVDLVQRLLELSSPARLEF